MGLILNAIYVGCVESPLLMELSMEYFRADSSFAPS